MKKLILAAFILSVCGLANAQTSSVAILQKSIEKIHALKSVSFKTSSIQKNPYSTGDTSFIKSESIVAFDKDGLIKSMNTETNINNGQSAYKEIYDDNSMYNIDLKDSVYTADKIDKKGSVSNDLSAFVDFVNYALKAPSKIFLKKDTIVNKALCYNFFIRTYDTVTANRHDFTHNYLVINKTTLLPVNIKQIGEGVAEKEGYVIGRLKFYSTSRFHDYQLNKPISNSLFRFNKGNFTVRNDKMLPDGVLAPELKLKDINNREVAASYFKNKVLLIEFGATDCGANPLANPMLNRLTKKYNSRDVLIVSVYSNETAEQVEKYIASNQLEFPIYLGNGKLKKAFKTVGTPGFYLIDKNGKIIQSNNGYSDELEATLSKQIDIALQ